MESNIKVGKGCGMGIASVQLSYRMSQLFGSKIISDHKPRELFGTYTPLTEEVFMGEVDRINPSRNIRV